MKHAANMLPIHSPQLIRKVLKMQLHFPAINQASSVRYLIAFISAVLILRASMIAWMDWPQFVTYLPDDTFYYLALGRNFSQLGQWTFDGGLTHTTGFHLLQAYQVALLEWLWPDSSPRLVVIINTLAALVTVALGLRLVQRMFGTSSAWAAIPLFLSYPFLSGAVSGMEWGYCIVFAALIFDLLSRVGHTPLKAGQLAVLALLGFVLELSRSDAGALTGSLFVGAILIGLVYQNRKMMIATGAALFGSVIGLALTLAHTWTLKGSLASGSAEVKLLWAERSGLVNSMRGGYHLFLQSLGLPVESTGKVILAVMMLVLAYSIWLLIKNRNHLKSIVLPEDKEAAQPNASFPAYATLITGSALAAIGYFVLFSMNMAVLFWYSALITLPLLVLFGAWVRLLMLNHGKVHQGTLLFICGALTVHNLVGATRPPFPHQRYMYETAQYIQQWQPDGRVGVWNAGIVGYFSPVGTVVNLDGLVNDSIIPYIRGNRLIDYIRQNNVTHIADFEQMIVGKGAQKLGGYDSDDFRNGIELVKVLSPVTSYINSAMGLYRIKPSGDPGTSTP